MVSGTTLARSEPQSQPGVPIRLRGMNWDDYLALSDLIDPRTRTSFSEGVMEIRTLSFEHEFWAALIGRLIEALTEELDRPCQSAGMTTFRRDDLERGLEPDRCYYLENEERVRAKRRIDLSVDPPPDLAIEVEITCDATARMGIYAAIGVPEVWRFDGTKLTVYHRTAEGELAEAGQSRHFPFLPLSELVGFLHRRGQASETAIVKSFREWVRQQIARNWQPEGG